jgi:hypothetical protein
MHLCGITAEDGLAHPKNLQKTTASARQIVLLHFLLLPMPKPGLESGAGEGI